MRTSRADRNYFAIAHGLRSLDAVNIDCAPAALLPPEPSSFASICKLTGKATSGLVLRFSVVAQGAEACLDANHEANGCTVHAEQWGLIGQRGEHVFKIKGGAQSIRLSGKVACGWTKRAAITLGEWSDQSTALVHSIDLSGLESDRPLSVMVARAKWPTRAELGRHRIDYLGSIGAKAYWWGKWALVKSGAWGLWLRLTGSA